VGTLVNSTGSECKFQIRGKYQKWLQGAFKPIL